MRYGFIFATASVLVESTKFLNLVELFKLVSKSLTRSINPDADDDAIRRNTNIAIDIFIVLKWVVLIYLMATSTTHLIVEILVWYLLAMNAYTYFYYHVWLQPELDIDGTRRRIINVALAYSFSIVCFAYFYGEVYLNDFLWLKQFTPDDAVLLSLKNGFASGASIAQARSAMGEFLESLQILNTFVFISMILGVTIPQKKKGA